MFSLTSDGHIGELHGALREGNHMCVFTNAHVSAFLALNLALNTHRTTV